MKSPTLFPFLLHSFPKSLISHSVYSPLSPALTPPFPLCNSLPLCPPLLPVSSSPPWLPASFFPPPSLLLHLSSSSHYLSLPSSFRFALSPSLLLFPISPFSLFSPLYLTQMVTGVVLLYFQSCDLVSLLCHRYWRMRSQCLWFQRYVYKYSWFLWLSL